jgi:hypothetical protein
MNTVMAPFLDSFVIVYLDDILVYSRTEEEHRDRVELVLETSRKHGLVANPKKCRFHQQSIEFLGYTVSVNGVHTAPSKIRVIKDWPSPKSTLALRRFLGLTNFYRTFVRDYTKLAQPLYSLLVKETPWRWGNAEATAFDALKTALVTAPLLAHPQPNKPLTLTTDASDTAVGGVLSQAGPNGEERPIAFESFALAVSLKNRPPYQQELYAIYHCCGNKWRCFLEGSLHAVTVKTDHKALVHTLEARTHPCRKMAGWVQELASRLNLKIIYIAGKENDVADALSRKDETEEQRTTLASILPKVVIEEGPWEVEIRNKLKDKALYKFEDGRLLGYRSNEWRLVPRIADRFAIVASTHKESGHRSAGAVYQTLLKRYWWPNMKSKCEEWISSCP